MKRLGISLYPEHSTPAKDKAYIETAARHGFTRIFTCLLSVTKSREEVQQEFLDLIDYAHQYGMDVLLDVAPSVFHAFEIPENDLMFFADMHADGIRLDTGFDGQKEAQMTYNPYGLKIELNASLGTKYIDNILSYRPNLDRITTCHNFYPQRYTGISYAHFEACSRALKDLNIPVAAFVSSQNTATYGPWPVQEGLCTLEMHRDVAMDVACRHLFASGLVDEVRIANAYASQEELAKLASIDPAVVTFSIELEKKLQPVEERILYDHHHFVRGDMSAYMARSTMPRITFKDAQIPAQNTRDLKRGDVVIVNDQYARYKGELHIVLQDMPNDGRKNVLGCIPKQEYMLLDYIAPWCAFAFMK